MDETYMLNRSIQQNSSCRKSIQERGRLCSTRDVSTTFENKHLQIIVHQNFYLNGKCIVFKYYIDISFISQGTKVTFKWLAVNLSCHFSVSFKKSSMQRSLNNALLLYVLYAEIINDLYISVLAFPLIYHNYAPSGEYII